MELIDALPALLAVARKRRAQRTGAMAVEFNDLREAARSIGYTDYFSSVRLKDALKALDAKRAANGTTSAKYEFPGVFSEQQFNGVIERAMSNANINHLGGEGLAARLIADKTFPLGLGIADFSYDLPASPRHLTTIHTTVVDTNGLRFSRGACVCLNVKPDSEDAVNLDLIQAARYSLDGITSRIEPGAADRVGLVVDYPEGERVEFAGGSLIWKSSGSLNAQFAFFFQDVKAQQ